MRQYSDLRVGFVDAAVLAAVECEVIGEVDAAVPAIVERLGARKLATLDRRHFSVMRPRHVDAIELLPAETLSR